MEFAQKLVSTKWGTLAAAGVAALAAGIVLLVYLNQYRDEVKAQSTPVTVLVARGNIPKGTSGSVIATNGLYTAMTIRESQLLQGAISDPASLRGRVATEEIFDGAQLTATSFVAGTGSLAGTLTKRERIVSIPLDSAHGLIGGIEKGNRVDVYAGFNVSRSTADGTPQSAGRRGAMLRLIMSDVPVIAHRQRRRRRIRHDERQPRRSTTSTGGEARIRLRQRQGLARAAAERRREGAPRRSSSRSRRSCSASPPVAGAPARSAAGREHADARARRARGRRRCRRGPGGPALGPESQVLAWLDAGARRSRPRGRRADLVIVACSGLSGSSIALSSGYPGSRPSGPSSSCTRRRRPNGFMQQVFEAGADDIVTLPEPPERIRHALAEGDRTQARRDARNGAVPASMITVLGPKGGTGKTVTSSNLAVALASAGSAPAWSTSICSSATSGSASASRPNARSTTSPSRAGRSTARRSTTTSPTIRRELGRCSRRLGPDQAAPSRRNSWRGVRAPPRAMTTS